MVNTEDKIMLAAREVFLARGYDGARMKEIADRAGINKALLHYYFRTKEKLFLAVFENAMKKLFPSIIKVFTSEGSLSDKIREFYEIHISFLLENPMVPGFIVSEMARRPESLNVFIENFKRMDLFENFKSLVRQNIDNGEIKEIAPEQLLLNIISLSVFPVIAEPLIKGVLGISAENYARILNDRKKLAADFVINSITCDK